MPMKHKDCEGRNGPATLTERGLAAIQSPGKPNGLSHRIFECLIVEASSQAQNHLSVLADRYTERCRGVFDCTGDGQCDDFGSGLTRWPRHFGMGSGPRSEERRVGKECRSRWSPDPYKKNI